VANKYILLTVDVEDWFQVENFKPWIPSSTWDSRELRVEQNTHRILDLFDSFDRLQVKATFFILGWIAKRIPHLIKIIHNRGHEVASHGFNHNLCTHESYNDLKNDLIKSKELLEDIIGARVAGYRAPNFSVNNEVLNIIVECGYLYDSSYNSFSLNPRYGRVDFNDREKTGIAINLSDNFYELPLSNLRLGNRIFPLSGGGYFRLIPSVLFKRAVRLILKKDGAYLFYIHPWEIDPDQPKVKAASLLLKFRHYNNLEKTELKLENFIQRFKQNAFITCSQYVEEVKKITL